MKRNFHRLLCLLCCVGCGMGMVTPAWGQWSFLGPQWLAPDTVSQHAIALDDGWRVHVASIEDGGATVRRYEGSGWTTVGLGLPDTGLATCAFLFAEGTIPWLALGPQLAIYTLPSGSQWLPLAGTPQVADARDLHALESHDGRRWLAWWQPGLADSTHIISDQHSTTWYNMGTVPGRLVDMALDDAGEPLLLLQDAPALLHLHNGQWNPYPAFLHPTSSYIGLEMAQDGSDSGAVVLRRSPGNGLAVERYTGQGWQQLGLAGFAAADEADLGLSHSGVLHVACVDRGSQGLPQVFQFVAGSWQFVGGPQAYNNTVAAPRLAFDPGAAFLLFDDAEQSLRSSVMYLGTPTAQAPAAGPAFASVFPNPVQAQVQVRLSEPVRRGELRLHDALGRTCGSWPLHQQDAITLSLQALPAGTYLLSLHSPTHSPSTIRLLKID